MKRYRFSCVSIFAICFFLHTQTAFGATMQSSESNQSVVPAAPESSLERLVEPPTLLRQITLPDGATAVLLTSLTDPPEIQEPPIIERDTLTGLPNASATVTLPFWLLMAWHLLQSATSLVFSPLTIGLTTLAVSVLTFRALLNAQKTQRQKQDGQKDVSNTVTRKRA